MNFPAYMKGAVWDFLLVALLAVSMTYQVLNCFYVDPSIQYSVIPGAVAVVECAALVAMACNKKTVRIGAPIYAVVAIIAIVACGAATESVFTDDEANLMIVAFVLVLTPTLVFLLSRKRTGCAFLFIICAFLVAIIEFFYMRSEIAWALIAIVSSIALIIYRNYQLSARTATTIKKFSFVPGFAAALAGVGIALAASAALWFGVIAPLNPSALDIKLVTEYRALETYPMKGVSSEYLTPNMDMTSSEVNSDSRTTDQLFESEDGIDTPANGNTPPENSATGQSAAYMGFDADSLSNMFDNINYKAITIALLVALCVALALIGVYFADRRVYRKQRLNKYSKLPATRQIEILYLFLVDKLKILGLGVPDGQTTLEYAKSIDSSVSRLDQVTGVSFRDLTGLYTAVTFGGYEADEADAELFRQYYRKFWKAARQYLGNMKYFVTAFRLG